MYVRLASVSLNNNYTGITNLNKQDNTCTCKHALAN